MIPISICIITKNEEPFIENCLKAIRSSLQVPDGAVPIPHEIVVADTGSTDRTREIALAYADKVVDFTWINDFSAARNFCISHASHEYILNIDSDEYITQADWYRLDALIQKNPRCIGSILLSNKQISNDVETSFDSRLERFFSKNFYHYENRVHEQIRPLPDYALELLAQTAGQQPASAPLAHASAPDLYAIIKQQIQPIPISANHVGYCGDDAYLKAKSKRDLILILEELSQNPANPYHLFQAGQCYHMIDQDDRAIEFYEKALLFDLDPNADYVKVLITSYGYCLIHLERFEEALGLEGIYDDFATNADFVILMGLIYAHNKLYLKALAEFVKALSFSDQDTYMQNANKQTARYNIGYIYEVFGEKEKAITQYHLCGDYPMAQARLQDLEG